MRGMWKGLDEPVDLVTMDASFIPLKILLPVAIRWFGPKGGQMVVLVKPQFEAGRKVVAKGKGVVRDPEVHRDVLMEVLGFAQSTGLEVRGLIRSPLTGPKGNTEFLAHLGVSGEGVGGSGGAGEWCAAGGIEEDTPS